MVIHFVLTVPFVLDHLIELLIVSTVFPTFTKTPSDIRVKVGNTARLECHAEGSPTPEIAWKKDGGDNFPAAHERRMHVMSNDDVFFIVNVKAADMGVYSCTAKNDAGVIIANATLTVLGMRLCFCHSLLPIANIVSIIAETPSFNKPMEDKTTMEGETTVLECMASGSPKPRLLWTKDGGPLVATERHFFTADNQLLIIVHTRASDAGRYECEMSNSLGTERDSSMLTVLVTQVAGAVLDDDSATIGIIIIAVVCCVVGTSIIWVIIIYQTRKRARNAPPSTAANLPAPSSHGGNSSTPFPGVEFIPAETDDPDLNIDIDGHMPTAILYPPDLEILAYKGTGSTQQLYTYLADNNSDSEQSSGKDSGTGDSARRSNSNEDVTALNDNMVSHSLHSLNTPPISEASAVESVNSSCQMAAAVPVIRTNPARGRTFQNYTRTLSTFVPQPRPAGVHLSEVNETDRMMRPAAGPANGADSRARMSLYEERRPRSSRNSTVGSPVANYSLARHEV